MISLTSYYRRKLWQGLAAAALIAVCAILYSFLGGCATTSNKISHVESYIITSPLGTDYEIPKGIPDFFQWVYVTVLIEGGEYSLDKFMLYDNPEQCVNVVRENATNKFRFLTYVVDDIVVAYYGYFEDGIHELTPEQCQEAIEEMFGMQRETSYTEGYQI